LESNASRRPSGWRFPNGYQRRNSNGSTLSGGNMSNGEQAHANMDYGG
jgi:hypothetical protein